MITFKIIRLIHLILYFIVAVQLCYYLYLMSDALKQVSIDSFLEQRRIVHPLVSQRHRWVYYATLIISLLMVIWSLKQKSPLASVTFSIAAVCVIADVVVAVKGNGPLNSLVQDYSLIDQTINWELVRERWLWFINIRALIILIGICSLFIGLTFRKQV